MKFLQGKIYSQMKNIRQINKIEEFRKIKKTFFPQLFFLSDCDHWQTFMVAGCLLREKHNVTFLLCTFFCFVFFVSDKCIQFSNSQQDALQICHSINNLHTENNYSSETEL